MEIITINNSQTNLDPFNTNLVVAYSIDEAFLDVTNYLKIYKMNAMQLAKTIMKDIFNTYINFVDILNIEKE